MGFGIFQEYYTRDERLNASASAIATIGASQTGIMYLMMPVITNTLELVSCYFTYDSTKRSAIPNIGDANKIMFPILSALSYLEEM